MERKLLQAWRKNALWLWLMLPLSWLYGFIFCINKTSYRWGLKKTYYAKVPVLVVGNITVGGSGKTPLIIAVVEYLQQKGIQVAVISRGYGGQEDKMPCIVTTNSLPNEVGDEPCLILQKTAVPMAVCPNRGQAIDLLMQEFPNTQLILADDGLQHFALDRDENWIVVDADRGMGNRQLLPTGFLREPIKRLLQAHTTVIFHQSNWDEQEKLLDFANSLSSNNKILHATIKMRLAEKPIEPLFKNTQSKDFSADSTKEVIAMTGLGYPQRFFNSLSKLGLKLIEKPLNDHHVFTLDDFKDLPDLPIVVTDKDAVKIRILLSQENTADSQKIASRIWVLPVAAELSPSFYALIDKQINELVRI